MAVLRRTAWVESDGFAERAKLRFEELLRIPADRVVLFTHATRSNRPISRSGEILRTIEQYGFHDFPLWNEEDVPHSSGGRPLITHTVAERRRLLEILEPYVEVLMQLIDEQRVVLLGKAAVWLLSGIPEIKELIESGGVGVLRYPCEWERHPEGVHGTLASYAERIQQSTPFPNELAFGVMVSEICSAVHRKSILGVWAARDEETRRAISDKMKAAWQARDEETRRAISEKMKAASQARDEETKRVISDKR
jgi:hypothetical protein